MPCLLCQVSWACLFVAFIETEIAEQVKKNEQGLVIKFLEMQLTQVSIL